MVIYYSNAVDNYIYLLDTGTKNAKNLPITNYRQADADFNGYEIEVGRSFTTNNGDFVISYGSCLLYTSPSPRDRG